MKNSIRFLKHIPQNTGDPELKQWEAVLRTQLWGLCPGHFLRTRRVDLGWKTRASKTSPGVGREVGKRSREPARAPNAKKSKNSKWKSAFQVILQVCPSGQEHFSIIFLTMGHIFHHQLCVCSWKYSSKQGKTFLCFHWICRSYSG